MFKLIRDNIPELMQKDGKVCNFAVAQNEELYNDLLKAKLIEEVNEFLNSGTVEELADIMTVISSLVAATHTSNEAYQKIYEDKINTRGGFAKKYIGFFPDQPAQEQPEQK